MLLAMGRSTISNCEANPDNTAPAVTSVSIPLGFEVLAHLSVANELR